MAAGPEVLGPRSGDARLDDAVRALALDLFVSPCGARALTGYWVATYVNRPVQPLPGASMGALLRALVLEAPQHFDVALVGHEREAGRVGFVLRFFDSALQLGVSHDFFVQRRRWRALRALAELVRPASTREPLAVAGFRNVEAGGLRGELRATAFINPALLDFYYNAQYLATLALEHFVQILASKTALHADTDLLRMVMGPVEDALRDIALQQIQADDRAAADAYVALADLCMRFATQPRALADAVHGIAAEQCAHAQHVTATVLQTWRATLN
jgi:hypothetical protein